MRLILLNSCEFRSADRTVHRDQRAKRAEKMAGRAGEVPGEGRAGAVATGEEMSGGVKERRAKQ